MALRLATNTFIRQTNKSLPTLQRGLATSSLDRTKSTEDYNRVLQTFANIRACAVLRTPTSDACPKAMQASIDGGFKIGKLSFSLSCGLWLIYIYIYCAYLVYLFLKLTHTSLFSFYTHTLAYYTYFNQPLTYHTNSGVYINNTKLLRSPIRLS